MILSTHTPCTKLTARVKKINIVTAGVTLRHADDCSLKAHVTMMVGRVLSNVTCKLGNLDFSLQLLLEASIQHLALRWLEAVKDVRNGSNVVILGEENELPIDEVTVVDSLVLCLAVVQEGVFLNAVEPVLPILHLALGESHINEASSRRDDIVRYHFIVHEVIVGDDISTQVVEMYFVDAKVREIFFGFAASTGTKTFVVFDMPSLSVVSGRYSPLLILRQGEERLGLLTLSALDDGGDELLQKPRNIQE
mmetsp:Transcript_30710/g.64371  ORF Transcript_30710/g.64371 Transcript_30710/m.64371 type:complete len:251 (-) Transcript_30710:1669-2421(-)